MWIRGKTIKMNIKKGFTLTKAKRTESGFTLIELLVVISIIGILAALATVSFASTQKQTRDTQRKSDLRQFQNALEVLANKNNGFYPEYSSLGVSWDSFCNALGMTTSCPNDPKYDPSGLDPNSFPSYSYQTDGTINNLSSATATKYALWAKLENTTGYWVICSSGTSFVSAGSPNIGSCP